MSAELFLNGMKHNYQLELEKIIEQQQPDKPTLLLHSCCAPCSSYCMEYLRKYFYIYLLYYNPNITNKEEYELRVSEQKRLIGEYNKKTKSEAQEDLMPIVFVEGRYEPKEFLEIAKGYETCKEGTERCFRCYELRLREAAIVAKKMQLDYFTTTLTISPLKNAEKLNEIGQRLSNEYGVSFLPSDFKKKNGYKRSIELSKEYNLYRQNYCGCAYSKLEREQQKSMENLQRLS